VTFGCARNHARPARRLLGEPQHLGDKRRPQPLCWFASPPMLRTKS